MLVITIGFCVKLNSKIVDIQKSKKDLATILKQFGAAIAKAENMTVKLQQVCRETAQHTDVVIDNANYQKDLNATSGKHAAKLESAIKDAKLLHKQIEESKKSLNYILKNTQLNKLSIKSNRMDWNKNLDVERDIQIADDKPYSEDLDKIKGASKSQKEKMVAIESLLQKISEKQEAG